MLRPIGALAALFLSTQSAFAVVYDCDITLPSPDGWMGDKIYFSIDEKENAVAVYDPLIHEVQEAPMLAELETAPNRYTVRWKLKGLKAIDDIGVRSKMPTAFYKAVIVRKTNKLMLTVNLSAGDNVPSGSGLCSRKEK
ncbi:hypothetical protein GR167_02835 [Rhodobacteraceae bacterium GS-10]|uniref:Uncharacterized protein n=2 Tax=Thalassovita mangrovi TaxID=2692236 RepID=A0A6L8LGV3_9RHOB|nr:hypothetical protein [Thalassovita mangrovi]